MICFMLLAGPLLPTSPFQPAGSSRLHKHLFWWRGRLLCHSCSSCCLSLNDGLQAFREILNVLENARHVLFCKFFLLAFPLAFCISGHRLRIFHWLALQLARRYWCQHLRSVKPSVPPPTIPCKHREVPLKVEEETAEVRLCPRGPDVLSFFEKLNWKCVRKNWSKHKSIHEQIPGVNVYIVDTYCICVWLHISNQQVQHRSSIYSTSINRQRQRAMMTMQCVVHVTPVYQTNLKFRHSIHLRSSRYHQVPRHQQQKCLHKPTSR